MAQLAADNFTRANGGLGANWSTVTSFSAPQISTNVVKCAISTSVAAVYSAITWPADQYSEFKTALYSVADGGGSGCMVRASAGSRAGYYLQMLWGFGSDGKTGNYLEITAVNGSGTITQTVDGPALNVADGDLIRLDILGNFLTAYQNGARSVSMVDTSVTSGTPGIWAISGGSQQAWVEGWTAGDVHVTFNTIDPALKVDVTNVVERYTIV